MTEKPKHDLDARMATLETEVHGIKSSIVSLAQDIRDLAAGNKTNWGTMAAWTAVIFTVVGGFTSTLYIINQMAIDRVGDRIDAQVINLDTQLNAITKAFDKHTEDGHPEAVIARFDSAINTLQSEQQSIRREIDLRDELTLYRSRFGELKQEE